MSASLLRKGLEMLEKDVSLAKKGKALYTEPVGTKRTAPRRHKQKGGRQRNRATVKGKVVKSAIEEYRKKHSADNNLQRNLKYMLGAKFVTDCAVTKQVLDQNRGRKALDRKPEEAKKKAVASVFTDTDFKRFEREYFGGGSGKV